MNSAMSARRRNISTRSTRSAGKVVGCQDVLGRKEMLCEELIRIDAVVKKLRRQRHIGPDMSSQDLLEIFCEERERLFAQLRHLDAMMAQQNAEQADPVSYSRLIELRRTALASGSTLDFL